MTTVLLRPVDTWFFRESRPMDAIGGSELASVFPPSPRLVLGALKTRLGEALGADWQQYAEHPAAQEEIFRLIGDGSDEEGRRGALELHALDLLYDANPLYPAPAFLLKHEHTFARLAPGEPVDCDLGRVRLPVLEPRLPGAKPPENEWLGLQAMNAVLAGGLPPEGTLIKISTLYHIEPRLGIARDNALGTVKESMLYQTRHVRPDHRLAFAATLHGWPEHVPPAGLVRLGGEGRLAAIESADPVPAPPAPVPRPDTLGLVLLLATAADFDGSWLPPGFTRETRQDDTGRPFDVFTGTLDGTDFRLVIHSACLGKARREGGWDLRANAPRPVRSLVPAGSAYFCTVEGAPLPEAIRALHGRRIGLETRLGRGRLFVGLWNQTHPTSRGNTP